MLGFTLGVAFVIHLDVSGIVSAKFVKQVVENLLATSNVETSEWHFSLSGTSMPSFRGP